MNEANTKGNGDMCTLPLADDSMEKVRKCQLQSVTETLCRSDKIIALPVGIMKDFKKWASG